MRFHTFNPSPPAARQCGGAASGLTLVELLMALGISSLLLAGVAALSLYGARSFSAIGNFAAIDADSRQAMDLLGRELRQGSAVFDLQTNLPVKSLSVTTDALGGAAKVAWDSQARTVTLTAHGKDRVLLKECDYWDVKLYTGLAIPSATNISLNTTTNPYDCKLIRMSWKCSRTNQGQQFNTESPQRMQIVLQNKFNY